MNEQYYLYVYLDPRYPGRFIYEDIGITFLFKPFYIGKGKRYRFKKHLKMTKMEASFNTHKAGTIKSIQNCGYNLLEYIIRVHFSTDENNIYDLEQRVIKTIGRHDIGLGPLTNQTDGGRGSFDKGLHNISCRKPYLRKKITMSKEQKQHLSDIKSAAINQIDKTTLTVINTFKNPLVAAQKLGIKAGGIYAAVSNNQPSKSSGGFFWEWVHTPNLKYVNGVEYKDKSGSNSKRAKTIEAYNTLTNEMVTITGIAKFCKEKQIKLKPFRESFITKTPQRGWIIKSYLN